jgi:predicted PurR-regulated permease PerM
MAFPPPTERQARLIWTALTGLAIATLVTLIVALVWGLGRVLHVLSPVLWPVAVAGVLACLLDPVVDFLIRRKVPRTRAIVFVFILALLIVVGLLASVVPQIVVEARDLATRTADLKTELPEKAGDLAANPPKWLPKSFMPALRAYSESATPAGTNAPATPIVIIPATTNAPVTAPAPPVWGDSASFKSVADYATKLLPKFGHWLGQVMGFVGSVFGVIAGLALIPIYAFYFLLEKHGIAARWRDYLPVQDSKLKDELAFVIGAIN